MSVCWYKKLPGAGDCDGRLRQCHLIPKQKIKQKFPRGGILEDNGKLRPVRRGEILPYRLKSQFRSLEQLQADERGWVWGCGGIMGVSGHHGKAQPDGFKLLVPRESIPTQTEAYARELGMEAWMGRMYGEPAESPL